MPKSSKFPSELVFASKGDKEKLFSFDPDVALATSYSLADQSRVTRCSRAIACGVIALIAKDIVGHGEFGAWLKNDTVSFLNPRTLQRYMAVARSCMLAQQITPRTMGKSVFLRWGYGDAAALLPSNCGVAEVVVAWIGERSLSEIYDDEGITRERDPHQKHTPSTQSPSQHHQLELAGIIEALEGSSTKIATLVKTGQWEKAPTEKVFDFVREAGAAIGTMVLGKTWTTAQKRAIENVFLGITTGLAGKGAGK
ncbi:MAG TPA: hypothetical protein VK961_06830 [Chthoniobacter sp.]|nr:hypothetical protein [Chthoniobacter sp.]